MRQGVMILLVALASCDQGDLVQTNNASASEIDRKIAAQDENALLSPGRWEGTASIAAVEIAGKGRRVSGDAAPATRFVSCLTPDEARRPAAGFLSGDEHGCRYDSFKMGGGQIEARLRCKKATGEEIANVSGSYQKERFKVTVASETERPQATSMTTEQVTMTFDAHRTGECRGNEEG